MCRSERKILFLAVLWLLLLSPPLAAEKMNLPQYLPRTKEKLSIQEKWVMERLALGEKADLKKLAATKQTEEDIYTLRGNFMEALLTDDFPNFKIHWHGADIRHATITGELNLEGGEIPFGVKLYNCVFADRVIMKECRFKRSLWIFISTFTKDVDCLRIEIEKNCYFNGCTFQGSLNFAWGRIGKEFSLIETSFMDSQEAKFEGLEIGTNALAHGANFGGQVNFYRATVGANMEFNDANFSKKAVFSEIRVNGNLGLHRAVFRSGASFSRATVGKGLLANNLTFTGKEEFASFPEMRIGYLAKLEASHFDGPVDLNGVTVGASLVADKAIFKKALHANGLTVQNTASFQGTVFEGPVGLSDADVGGQITFSQAKFNHKGGVEAYGLRVGQLAKATNAFFAGPLNLTGAKIGGELRADVHLEQGTVLEGVGFLEKVTLSDAQLSDLIIRGAPSSNLKINFLNLDRVVVNRDLILQDIVIGDFMAHRAVGKGQTELKNVVIKQKADLQDSNFLALKLYQVSWPDERDKINLSGMTYQTIGGESWESILQWLNLAVFDTRNYTIYQTYLERTGKGDWADDVFISMKRREWGVQTWRERLNPLKWPLLLFWDWPVGYGRKPENIFWFGLPFIIFGAVVLDPRYLDGINWPQKNKLYEWLARLLLSVDKFTPKLMEFGLEDKWQPPKLSGFMQFFLHVYKIMGKVFLSIFFIAIYARFK